MWQRSRWSPPSATAVALSGGDDPSGDSIAVDQPSGPQSTLVMTRPDGSTYAFPDVTVSCEPPMKSMAMGSLEGRIWMWSPIDVEGAEADGLRYPFVYFEGIVAEIEGDQTITFPTDWPMDSAHIPMLMYIADSEKGNEVSSDAGGETGTIRVLEATCDPTPVLRLEVDMTLGSEELKDPIDLSGAVR